VSAFEPFFDPQIAPIPADSKGTMALVLNALYPFLRLENQRESV
jgi:hypothetical protein